MRPIDVTLGLSDEVLRGLRTGSYTRDGGVIREVGSGRIVALLRDADLAGSPLEHLLESSVVPLAVQGISMAALERRLARLEHVVRHGLDALAAEVALATLRLEASLLGELLGDLQACALDVAAERRERVPEYRRRLLVAYHRLRLAIGAAVADRRVLRAHADAIRQTSRAALLAGMAARELTVRLGESAVAGELIASMADQWTALDAQVRQSSDVTMSRSGRAIEVRRVERGMVSHPA